VGDVFGVMANELFKQKQLIGIGEPEPQLFYF
jgi:hypothetical protein